MDDKESARVGVAIRRRRRALSLTLAAVSGRSGLSVPFLSQIENERARPSRTSLERVADALGTTAVELLSAADAARTVEVVRAESESQLQPDTDTDSDTDSDPESGAGRPVPSTRRLVHGHHQLHALEFIGDHDAGREFQHRNDELMYVVEGAVEVEAEGRAYRLARGDSMFLSGGVRHRWRAAVPETRVLVVAVGEHVKAERE
ncbi:XRE family transcriptional regulator [Streptomyces sp. B-S-A8]|uniref:XRE family transcriptional regulator n=2 Tax=Streptomyces solicavernae TaxID=3043614 RepID=A0ABT6RR09_9ACTN|nr:XRE family transcriptional regulator [Streptomyces sp. B-S-A8]MDI3386864.1 XRE family transcriptional regulator [Streptomyces sp. B-S-A8]